jgi:hypothetical protein
VAYFRHFSAGTKNIISTSNNFKEKADIMDIFNRVKLESDLKLCEELKGKIISGEIPSVIVDSIIREFDPVIKASEGNGLAEKIVKSFGPEFDHFLFDQKKAQDFNIKNLVSCETKTGIPLSLLFQTDVNENDFLKSCLFLNQLLSIKERGPRFYIHNLQGKRIHALRGTIVLKSKEVLVPSLRQWDNGGVILEWDTYYSGENSFIEVGDLISIKKE